MVVDYNYHYAGEPYKCILTKQHLVPIAWDYERIIQGQRGVYVEFLPDQFWKSRLYMPQRCYWRMASKVAYYWEYRDVAAPELKIYLQKRTVAYADYRVGRYYISVHDLWGFYSGNHMGENFL